MLGFLKRIAAASRFMFGSAAVSTRDDVKAEPAPAPGLQGATALLAPRADMTGPASLKVTISKPEPVAGTEPKAAVADNGDRTDVAAVPATPATAPRAAAPLRSQRRALSPIALKKTAGRSISQKTPRPAKPAARTPVRTNRISGDSVRMQAALMRCQRQRDADRALAKLKATLPTATILTLQRAA